ncbi:hypothetical protein SPRG_10047 [Saprolegnia parasitica CBS 223.65]|uniref:Uncharacterized protein n=1 Tax=Saprolegnia parasitica (strain CBS 223.65) TaxID=695850 RepID=A0A067CAQ4_SAPPC|nr:hypothetical protein SPRG_10047 [Saprolegnia parasitica CBS 223.65]KDO23902.1 hypothetical protein SPRG_10047 [Saprolegnia parasitica CBS 223.65]|eukprot:XP_012205371.1 hypothetical protein SPRG_10047 [Saprolegnia parasitica CBS 223.65]
MFGLKKLACIAVAALAAMASASSPVNTTAPAVNGTSVVPPASQYTLTLFGKLLGDLNIEHVEGQPLTDEEYNKAVDDLEELFLNKVPKSKLKEYKAELTALLARISVAELEQLFSDVSFELTKYVLEDSSANTTATANVTVPANTTTKAPVIVKAAESTNDKFLGLDNKQIIVSGGAIGGFMVVVAVALAVSASREKKAAPAQSVLADNVIDEIEAAEKASPAAKDADVEDMTSESPSVVSV